MLFPTLNYASKKIFVFFASIKGLLLLIIGSILPINTIFQLIYVHQWNNITILDGILYQFGLNTLYYLVICPSSLFLIYDICKPDSMDVYSFIRLGRSKMAQSKLITLICALTIYYTLLVLCSCIILSFCFNIGSDWGNSLIESNGMNGALFCQQLFDSPPWLLIVCQILYTFLSTLTISLLLLLFAESFQRKPVALIATITLNFLLLILSKTGGIPKFLNPASYTFLSYVDAEKLPHILWTSMIYWLFFISVFVIANYLIITKKDYIYENSSDIDA